MRKAPVRRLILITITAALVLAMGVPADAQLFSHHAFGQGTDGVGNRLTIVALDNALLGGVGIAFVRLSNQGGPATIVILTCVIFDERPGPGFHFVYASGRSLSGRTYYIGAFDDHGAGRTGPYDAIYTQTSPVNGPCNVSAVTSYPVGWFPVASGDYVVN